MRRGRQRNLSTRTSTARQFITEKRMRKISKFTKIAASALCLVTGAAATFGCGEKPMPPYDPATRTPTDANEIAYTINAITAITTTTSSFTTATATSTTSATRSYSGSTASITFTLRSTATKRKPAKFLAGRPKTSSTGSGKVGRTTRSRVRNLPKRT